MFVIAMAGIDPALDVHFLRPDAYSPLVGKALPLRLDAGPAQPASWPAAQVDWLFWRAEGNQENRDAAPAMAADAQKHEISLNHAGMTLAGVELRPHDLELSRDELIEFLSTRSDSDSHQRAEALSKPRVRIRRVEAAAAIIRVRNADGSDAGGDASAVGKCGLHAEIRAGMNPARIPPGSDLALRPYVNGDKRTPLRITASNDTTGQQIVADANSTGFVNIRIVSAGLWRLEFHRFEAAPESETDIDGILYSGTLCFETPTEGGR